MPECRFPPPWSVEDIDGPDGVGQKLAVYFDNPLAADKPLTRDEARRIAANVAELPKLLQKPSPSLIVTSRDIQSD